MSWYKAYQKGIIAVDYTFFRIRIANISTEHLNYY